MYTDWYDEIQDAIEALPSYESFDIKDGDDRETKIYELIALIKSIVTELSPTSEYKL